MKNDKIEIPKVEEKVLKRFKVTRKAVVEFEFEVLAESKYDAEQIVEDLTSLTDYCDTYGADYQTDYYDTNGYVSKIDSVQTGSGWWNDQSMYVYEIKDDTTSIFKMENEEWDYENNVYESEEDCISAWKTENGIEDEDEDEDDN